MKHRGPYAFRRVVRRLHISLPKITQNRYWNASIFAIRISKNAHLVFREPPWNDIFGTSKCCISLRKTTYLARRSARNHKNRFRNAPGPPKDSLWAAKWILVTVLGRHRGPRYPPWQPPGGPLWLTTTLPGPPWSAKHASKASAKLPRDPQGTPICPQTCPIAENTRKTNGFAMISRTAWNA